MYLPGVSEVSVIAGYLTLVCNPGKCTNTGSLTNSLKLLKDQITFIYNKRIKKNLVQSNHFINF